MPFTRDSYLKLVYISVYIVTPQNFENLQLYKTDSYQHIGNIAHA